VLPGRKGGRIKTQYYTASSLDGFIAGPGHSLDWLLQLGEGVETSYDGFIAQVGAIAMGSHTYEWLLRHLAQSESAGAQAWPYRQPCWVFSTRSLPTPPGADVRLVRGNVGPVHAAMVDAAGGRNRWIVGGGDLAGQFHDAGLLDELIVQLAPVTLGAGFPLLPRAITSPPLRLLSSRTYGGVFVEVRYEVPRRVPGEVEGGAARDAMG
jgi:dihydrofolate reductase